jgi:hypothetical protein
MNGDVFLALNRIYEHNAHLKQFATDEKENEEW